MKKILFIICFLTFVIGCQYKDKKVEKDKLLGNDYRLFQDTPIWDLAKAVEDEDIPLITRLSKEKKLLIDYQEPKFGNTLLMLAIENNDYESVKKLLDLGADPNISDNYRGATSMHEASKKASLKYLKLLIRYRGDPNAVENKFTSQDDLARDTPLNVAISYGSTNNLEKVKLLVEAGANVNYHSNGTPFYTHLPLADAIVHRKFDIALYLLEHGADTQKLLYKTAQGDSIYILGALRRSIVGLDTDEYKQKQKLISFLKSQGLDYTKEPIPEYIKEEIKRKYPNKYPIILSKY